MTLKTKVEFGKTYCDKVSGFTGIVTGVACYDAGCIRVALTAKVNKDGKLEDPPWFDEARLEPVKADVKTVESRKTGGGPNPTERMNPVR